MARSDRKRLVGFAFAALLVPLAVACNSVSGLSDFEKTECPGRRCGEGGISPPVDGGLDVNITDAPPEVRGSNPVSWAQWRMPNSDGGAEFLPNGMKYTVVDGNRIEDGITGLVWRSATLPSPLSYDDAKRGCTGLDPMTGPWRLPKRIELVTLLDFARSPFLIDPKFTGVKNVRVWTSSESRVVDYTVPTKPVAVVTDAFWTVDFGTGVVDVLSTAGEPVAGVLCVRAK